MSLADLNRSRSRQTTAKGLLSREASLSASASRTRNRERFANPVRASWWAMCRIWASACSRSLMSRTANTRAVLLRIGMSRDRISTGSVSPLEVRSRPAWAWPDPELASEVPESPSTTWSLSRVPMISLADRSSIRQSCGLTSAITSSTSSATPSKDAAASWRMRSASSTRRLPKWVSNRTPAKLMARMAKPPTATTIARMAGEMADWAGTRAGSGVSVIAPIAVK